MVATLLARYYGGSGTEPAGIDATTGIRFNREDTQIGTAGPIPIPQSGPNTYFSWYKQVALAVTSTDPGTSITNRTIKAATNVSFPTGVGLYWLGTPSYRQATSGTAPHDQGSNGAVPSDPSGDGTYTVVTITAAAYDPTSLPSSVAGRNGRFCRLAFGVDVRYTGGAGLLTLPNLIMGYDEF